MTQTTTRTRWRIAVSLSVIWVAAAFFLSEESERFRGFLVLGVLPVLIGWAVRWVLLSHRAEQEKASHTKKARFLRRR
jgi:hypothetical protein